MRRIRSSALLVALLVSACTWSVEVNGAPYVVSVRPLAHEATGTPTATLWPPPTVAPTVTPTPGATAWPTPTPEPPIPTRPPATPEKGNCIVKLGSTAINERTAPSASAPKTATSPIPAGSLVLITEFTAAEGYLWAHDAFGWFVVRQGTSWWVTFTAETLEFCIELPGYPTGVQPPNPIVRALPGVWAGPGVNRDELLQFGARVKAAGQPAATVYGDAYTAELLLANGWFVMRRAVSVPDCPDTALPAEISAASFIGKVIAAEGVRAQVIVGANECAWPSAVYARDWVRAAVQTAKARGVRAVAPVVWNPGAPELDWVPVLAPAYRDAPIVVAWALNLYPARANTGLAVRDDFTAWTTWRYEMYRHHLRGVPFVVTEYARGDGSEPPDFADIRAWWALARYQVDVATAWYAAAPLGHWAAANLRGRLREMAGAVE